MRKYDIYEIGAPCIYVADKEEPWKYVYASFCGADDDAPVHSAGLDRNNVIFDFPLDEDMIHDFDVGTKKLVKCKKFEEFLGKELII